jgi:competence protein ComEA
MRLVTSFTAVLLIATLAFIAPLHGQAAQRASKGAAATATSPINLNTATAAQLETLPGVGKSTAQRIVEFRQKNGGFKKIEELMNVKGIGEKSFLKLKPLITVKGDASADGK